MPEGDTIYAAAERLRPVLDGARLVAVEGSHGAIRSNGRRLAGRTVTNVRTHGKHLLVDFDNGWTLRTHLRMTGSWDVYRPDERWRVTPGKARVVLRTEEHVAVCFATPAVDLAPTPVVDQRLGRLGPDLMADDFDESDYVRRARAATAPTAAELLLDQGVAAGVGNVVKSETLFLCGTHPDRPPSTLSDAELLGLATRARALLLANRHGGRRATTGQRRRGAELWVYGRAGKACLRCSSRILSGTHGDLGRATYWCPRCQPEEPAS